MKLDQQTSLGPHNYMGLCAMTLKWLLNADGFFSVNPVQWFMSVLFIRAAHEELPRWASKIAMVIHW